MDCTVKDPVVFWRVSLRRLLPLPIFLSILFIPPSALATETFLMPLGPVAEEQKVHFFWAMALTMVAVLPVFILVPVILIKYRRKKSRGFYAPKWETYGPLEVIMWGIPFLIITVLSIMLWRATARLDPYEEIQGVVSPVKIQVVGLDWKWLFIYPELDIATVGELVVPVHTPISMTLTSDTVMQSFLISALVGQIYVMPGMTTKLNFIGTQTGATRGENTQYSGEGFVEQNFAVEVVTEDRFDTWVQTVRSAGIELNSDNYNRLAQRGTKKQAYKALGNRQMPANTLYFNLPDSGIFQQIVMRYHSGQPLSTEEQPGTRAFGRDDSDAEGARP